MVRFKVGINVIPTKLTMTKYSRYYTNNKVYRVVWLNNLKKEVVYVNNGGGYLEATSEYFKPAIPPIGGE